MIEKFERNLDRQRETLTKLRADVVIPSPRFQQVLIRLWCPDDRERHGFFNSPALTELRIGFLQARSNSAGSRIPTQGCGENWYEHQQWQRLDISEPAHSDIPTAHG